MIPENPRHAKCLILKYSETMANFDLGTATAPKTYVGVIGECGLEKFLENLKNKNFSLRYFTEKVSKEVSHRVLRRY